MRCGRVVCDTSSTIHRDINAIESKCSRQLSIVLVSKPITLLILTVAVMFREMCLCGAL